MCVCERARLHVRCYVDVSLVSPSLTLCVFPDEEVLNEEELDKDLLWNLQLLSEVSLSKVYIYRYIMTENFIHLFIFNKMFSAWNQ